MYSPDPRVVDVPLNVQQLELVDALVASDGLDDRAAALLLGLRRTAEALGLEAA